MSKRERSNHAVFRLYKRGDGTSGVDAYTPERVLPIHNEEELQAQLVHYAKLLASLTTVNSVQARRHYVELIRPALRYYCRKFQVDVPDWLKNDEYYTNHMSISEKQKQFGMKPLRIKEFQQIKRIESAEQSSHADTGAKDNADSK